MERDVNPFFGSSMQGKFSRFELMESIGDLDCDLIDTVKHTQFSKQVKVDFHLIKSKTESAEIDYSLKEGWIESLSFSNGHSCATEQFGTLVVAIGIGSDGESFVFYNLVVFAILTVSLFQDNIMCIQYYFLATPNSIPLKENNENQKYFNS